MQKKILYISSNDGSDMRINKEINSLLKKSTVIFVGIGKKSDILKTQPHLITYFVKGNRKSFYSYCKLFGLVCKLLFTKKIASLHVVNEQLMIFFWPLLFFKHVVLDVFDSIFLKLNIKPNGILWLKYLVYAPVNKVIVTDENRKNLMPVFLHHKIYILPNYTNYFIESSTKIRNQKLNIMFYGWLGMNRGGRIIKKLLSFKNEINVIMYGWFSDTETKKLLEDKRVIYNGVISQKEALQAAYSYADYILCVYDPVNNNNINASPNKIYDSIQTGVPLIVNKEVKISEFVQNHELGVVFDSMPDFNEKNLYEVLKNKKDSFEIKEELKNMYSWENMEQELFKAHRL